MLGSVQPPAALELGAPIDAMVPAGTRRLYRIALPASGSLSISAPACRRGQGAAARGAAALRLFDAAGNAVSDRRSNCGSDRTGELPSGAYYLLLAGPTSGPGVRFRLRVG